MHQMKKIVSLNYSGVTFPELKDFLVLFIFLSFCFPTTEKVFETEVDTLCRNNQALTIQFENGYVRS